MQSTLSSNEAFDIFFKNWLGHQQVLLKQLLDKQNHDNNNNNSVELISKVLCHYADFYEHKAKIIWHDIFILFSPPWLTPFEKPFLWLTGFKPSLAFAIIEPLFSDIDSEQAQRLGQLRAATVREERDLMDEFAIAQESVGSPSLFISLIRQTDARDVVSELDDEAAMQAMRHSMSWVVQSADNLRRNTVLKMVEILSMKQNLKFLAAVVKYQFRIRAWGSDYNMIAKQNE